MTARDAAMRGFFQTLRTGVKGEETDELRTRDKYTRPAPTAVFQVSEAGKRAATRPLKIGSHELTPNATQTPVESVPLPEPAQTLMHMPGRAPIEMLQREHYSVRAPPHGMPTRKPFANPHAGPRFAS